MRCGCRDRVDSNVWIFLNIESAPEHAAAVAKIEQHRGDGLQINAIIVSEVFHKLQTLAGTAAASIRVNKMLESDFVVYEPLSRHAIDRALVIAAQAHIRINDAMIAAHAVECRQSVLTDDVSDFRRIKGLNVLGL